MTWEILFLLQVGGALVLYLVLIFLYIWLFYGGNDSGNYYKD